MKIKQEIYTLRMELWREHANQPTIKLLDEFEDELWDRLRNNLSRVLWERLREEICRKAND